MSEREQLEKAVDEFAAAMKARLLSKFKQGWRGWEHISYSEASNRMLQNASQARENGDAKSLVDTANLAMMLWRKK